MEASSWEAPTGSSKKGKDSKGVLEVLARRLRS